MSALTVSVVAIGALAACSASTSAPSLPAPSVSILLGAASSAFRQGDYNAATQLFQQAIRKDPSNAIAYYDLGTVYQAQNLDAAALAQYSKALSLAPDMVPALFNQATIYAVHDAPLAIFLYRRVIHLQSDSPTAYLNLGLLEAQQGAAEQRQAGADLRTAIKLEPSLRSNIPASVLPDLSLPAPVHRNPPPTVPAP